MTDPRREPPAPGMPASPRRRLERLLPGRFGRAVTRQAIRLGRAPRGPHPAQLSRWPAVLAAAVALMIVLALIADAASVPWARSLPPAIAWPFQAVTDIGKSGWVLVPSGLMVVLLLAADWSAVEPRTRAAWSEIGQLLTALFIAVATGGIVTNVIKQVVGRARPVLFDREGPLSFDAFNFDYANASFPSGHATTAGAILAFGWLAFPRGRPVWAVVAIVIAVSRIVVGAHFPSDVVAGLIVGGLCATASLAFLARRRFALHVGHDGRLRPRLAATRHVLAKPSGFRRLVLALKAGIMPVRRQAAGNGGKTAK